LALPGRTYTLSPSPSWLVLRRPGPCVPRIRSACHRPSRHHDDAGNAECALAFATIGKDGNTRIVRNAAFGGTVGLDSYKRIARRQYCDVGSASHRFPPARGAPYLAWAV